MWNRHTSRAPLAVVFVMVGACATASMAALPRAELEPVPEPDLGRLEPAVAGQMEAVRADLVAALANPSVGDADVAEAFGVLGELLHAYEMFDSAAVCYRNAGRLSPRDYRWLHLLADVERRRGSLAEAAKLHEAALRVSTDDVPTLIQRGEVLLELNEVERAGESFRTALHLDPSSAAARAGMGNVALARRDYAEAVASLEAALEAVPQATRLHYALAMAYRGLGRMEEARRHLALNGPVGLRAPDPLIDGLRQLLQGERVHILRGRLAFAKGRYADAEAEFRRAVDAAPGSAPALVNLGSTLGKLGDVDGALKSYRQALAAAPDNAAAHFNSGLLLGNLDRHTEAAEHLGVAADAWPEDAEAQRLLAKELAAAGREEEAVRRYALASRLDPTNEETVLDGADLMVRLRRFREAREVLEAAHRRTPERGRTALALAYLLAACPIPALRDGPRAVALAEQIVAAAPEDGHLRILAMALAEAGRCGDAARVQRRRREDAKRGTQSPLRELRSELERYEAGPPCRPPFSAPPPGS